MDTRGKIISVEHLPRDEPVTLVIGSFDPLYAAHARRLAEIGKPGTRLVVAVDAGTEALVPVPARAELVAALGCVDLVVTDVDGAREALPQATVIDERTADSRRRQQLIELVVERHQRE